MSDYQKLIEKNRPPPPKEHTSESELDSLLTVIKEREKKAQAASSPDEPDRIQALRTLTINELVGIFMEIKEKYAASGVSLELDVSNFLSGGREIKMEFGFGEYRAQLLGTVTTEAIAFHETRYAPDIAGELVSGPMLRLRNLDGKVFREFVCERLTALLRTAIRRR